jgi:hypothetical protein
MVKHIFAISVHNNFDEEKYEIIAAETQNGAKNKCRRYLIANHINSYINAYDNDIENKHT